ncbi:anhydro-N-acetylmuramic acid kinase [Oharaeibacter diazotrophicus]|uniref:Anhydro-N-acetylmuramic acid kinase n=3 Tax=Oharaeibacter diazotrophicus TaxID=1920512 RepID=A0A4V3CWK5_9HYPH|nr:anhydro-N-acetylmuramic acid kinase [Oharaeibacter diazotrophicus]TDP86668.1 anhydro-N-acetylmuramic acid kinase [Oharaeibacter diazotrophicus]BBE71390.1 anhydro-N-acetylmuramic acid kinase [Pleomorphomonas sp. SM30]GLS78147.1 anhydro-N-acetylmuramic acid kinase [Oharaeibacter diazotrophicus]
MTGAGPVWALGLMSGTSLDGVDAALLDTDGETIAGIGPTLFRPYGADERAVLRRALADARGLDDRRARPGALAEAERIVTDTHAEAVRDLVAAAAEAGIAPQVVGFHGQTVFHAPARRLTVQIGDAGRLAAACGLRVVHDFRAADVAAGGQGAPLVPIFHRALAARAGLSLPAAVLNVGGVANVTLIGADGRLAAFDTGPGNALIDDAVLAATGRPYDDGGAIAASGRVDGTALAALLAHPYFAAPPPKSLDRDAFDVGPVAALPFADKVATLTAFTAAAVAAGLRLAGAPAATVVVVGGGARNRKLLAMLAARTGATVVPAGDAGFDGDFVEAQAFAHLAVRRLRGLPATFPGTTGVPAPTVGGDVATPEGAHSPTPSTSP